MAAARGGRLTTGGCGGGGGGGQVRSGDGSANNLWLLCSLVDTLAPHITTGWLRARPLLLVSSAPPRRAAHLRCFSLVEQQAGWRGDACCAVSRAYLAW
jgi:hypothetical protein